MYIPNVPTCAVARRSAENQSKIATKRRKKTAVCAGANADANYDASSPPAAKKPKVDAKKPNVDVKPRVLSENIGMQWRCDVVQSPT